MSAIVIKNLKKSFESHFLYNNLNLDIPCGSFFAILGRSGCGKSILLKHILGLISPDSGEILVDGVSINQASATEKKLIRQKWSMVFQEGALFDSLLVWENVIFFLRYHSSLDVKNLERIALEKLEWVGLQDKSHVYPSQLSGGMRKRVAIARAIATDPKIIFYDEPTTGLDPITCNVINSLMARLHQQIKGTSVIVTHDLKSVYSVCDRVAMLHDGEIVFYGTVSEMKNTDNSLMKEFLEA